MILALPHASASTPRKPLETIRKRLVAGSLAPVTHEAVQDILSHLKSDGSFDDLAPEPHDLPAWGPLIGVSRALSLLQAYATPEAPDHGNGSLKTGALSHLRFWAAHQKDWPLHFNWWHNEIGLPLLTHRILLLAEPELDESTRKALDEATARGDVVSHPSHFQATGQNLIWYCKITVAFAAIRNRPDAIRACRDRISDSLKPVNGQGIQKDGSFFQHGETFYNGGYGISFSQDLPAFMVLLDQTPFAFSKRDYETLAGFLLGPQLSLIRGTTLDLSSMGRYYAREASDLAAPVGKSCETLAKVKGRHRKKLLECAERIAGGRFLGNPGIHSFYKSDFVTDNHEGYAVSLKMRSNRSYNSDTSPLGEGLVSEFLSDGVTWIYRTGLEYRHLFPVLDPFRLPGVTEERLPEYPKVPANNFNHTYGPTSFVLTAEDGERAVSSMFFVRQNLSARKAWFFHEGGMLALAGALDCQTCEHPVSTSVNQEWSRGPVSFAVSKPDGNPSSLETLEAGRREIEAPARIEANGVGYLVFGPKRITLENVVQKGSWKKLDVNKSDREVSGKVIHITLEHGTRPDHSEVVYEVFPGLTGEPLREKQLHPDFEVLENSYYRQAAYFEKEKLLQAAFYWPGKVSTRDPAGAELEVDSPCVVQLREKTTGMDLVVRAVLDQPVQVKYRWRGGKPVTRVVKHPSLFYESK